MLARVAWGKVKPGTWDEYEHTYREQFVPGEQRREGPALP